MNYSYIFGSVLCIIKGVNHNDIGNNDFISTDEPKGGEVCSLSFKPIIILVEELYRNNNDECYLLRPCSIAVQFKQWSERKATDSTNIRGEAELCQLLLHSLEAFPMCVLLYAWFVSQNNIDNNSFTSTDEAEIFEPGRNNNFNEIEKPQENQKERRRFSC